MLERSRYRSTMSYEGKYNQQTGIQTPEVSIMRKPVTLKGNPIAYVAYCAMWAALLIPFMLFLVPWWVWIILVVGVVVQVYRGRGKP